MATYKDLSMELKVWIWEHVAAELLSGAHRFRLTQHPKRPGRLVLTPGNDEKQDSSTWRERIRLAKIDGASLYAFTKLLAKMEQGNEVKVVYHDTQRSRRINVAENGVAARVYRGTDLMTFRWNFGTTAGAAYALNTPANRSLFDGITQFGIEIDLIQKGWMHTTKYKPFVCLDCIQVPGHAGVGSVCYAGVLRFLELFKDLKIVYIVFTIKAVDCSSPEIEELKAMNTQPRRQVTDPKKARICQAALDAFQAIRSIAVKKGLKQFHNRDGTFCEIDPENMSLARSMLYPVNITKLREAWAMYHASLPLTLQNRDWRTVKFKPLLWADLRHTTVVRDAETAPDSQ